MFAADLERDVDTERRKTTTLQDSLKESEKEYHKLKVCDSDTHAVAVLLTMVFTGPIRQAEAKGAAGRSRRRQGWRYASREPKHRHARATGRSQRETQA